MPEGAPLEILYEDNHLLAVNKPAMLPTMGVEEGRASLLTVAKDFIRRKYRKPGNVYLGIVSRLDAPVTGLVLLAKTSKSAARLSEAFRRRDVKKSYLAVVEGAPLPGVAVLEHYLRKDERHRKVHATHEACPDAQLARLQYQRLANNSTMALVQIELETGRKHQIRVQLAKVGHAIVGDRKYGSKIPFDPGVALHAHRLELEHPVKREPLALEAPVPASWRRRRDFAALLADLDPPGTP
jgi:23S rRNA pseudouridine1911/1915/1917 synthase